MSITDELRERIAAMCKVSGLDGERLYAIADRIDEQHRRALERVAAMVDEAYENGERDERADWLDETDGGYIKLPVDADGVPIRVGDTIEIDHNGRVTQVDCITCWEDSWMVCCSEGGMFDPKSTLCRHVQRDSWERIIKDAQEYVTDDEPLYSVSELVERCRRLAGEA